MTRSHYPDPAQLIIGQNTLTTIAIAEKIRRDVNFLQLRLAAINSDSAEGDKTRQTYQQMLDSRRSVLAWIDEYSSKD